jgi:DNA-binding winged helix-turn-helix (wHTH) protein/tetratricopeptide (TPR) repeat protein
VNEVTVRSDRYRFDQFEFDATTLELFDNGQSVRLQRQPALVLRLLLEHRGSLVTRAQLQAEVWGPDRHVDVDRSLAYCLRQIRAALGDRAEEARYVETLRGRGYRFVGLPAATAPARPQKILRRRQWGPLALAGLAAILVVAVVAPTRTPVIDAHVLLTRADAYLDRSEVDDVVTALEMYRRLQSDTAVRARALAGMAAAEAFLSHHYGDRQLGWDALQHAQNAAALAPGEPRVRFAMARGLHAAGHFDAAEAAYRTAVASSGSPDATDHFALLLYQRGRLDEAVDLLNRRWSDSTPDPSPAGLMAVILTELGFTEQATAWSHLATELAPRYGQSKYLEGLSAFRAGRLTDAHDALQPLITAHDPAVQVVTLAALVDAHRFGPAAAQSRLEAVVASRPESHTARSLLGDVHWALGRQDEARQEWARVAALCRREADAAQDSPVWPRCLASQLALQGDFDAAAAWYDKAVQLGWRKLVVDRDDGRLEPLAARQDFQLAQHTMRQDLSRMRSSVARRGVPVPPVVR